MKELLLNVEPRTEIGKNANSRLRSSGYVPGIMYWPGSSEKIKVLKKDFQGLFHGHISESVLITLNISGSTEAEKPRVFVKDYQVDPVTNDLVHLDLYKVTAGHKIRTMVPIEIKGSPIGAKTGGILEILERVLEIECLPSALPEKVVVDVTNLEVGQSIHIRDLNIGEGVKFLSNPERVIAAVLIPHIAKEETPAEAAAEGEEGAAEGAEGEAAKEGEKPEKSDKKDKKSD
ncbi:MAG: 50S ribosomal protein L25 [Spirochaetes bacterium]|jgi:large subunit ribosomal protein L25|nr:50S ribosomal protein L25 [Spirochaetota bacterium]